MDTDEAIKQKLEALGLDGGWRRTAGGPKPPPESVQRQRDMLRDLAKLLEVQLEQDRRAVTDLHARRLRMKHGGGA